LEKAQGLPAPDGVRKAFFKARFRYAEGVERSALPGVQILRHDTATAPCWLERRWGRKRVSSPCLQRR